jgi:PadR family transcriptional regulator
MPPPSQDLLQGTLDLLVLRTLSLAPLHGYGVVQRLTQVTRGAFRFNAGSVFPALYRLEREGYLESSWAETVNKRRAKYYALTRAGRRKLAEEKRQWEQAVLAIAHVLEGV